jgi:type I restriction enzyme S subunit
MNRADSTVFPLLRFKEFDQKVSKHLFENIFLFTTGKNIKQKEASPEFETPCVRYGELYHMYDEVINKVVNKTNLNKSDLLFSKGDEILLPSAGEDPLDIGSASALTLQNIAIGRTINILRPLKENVYSQIFTSYFINQKLRRKISTLAKGSSISNVYNSDLKTLTINLPTLPEQQKIASFLSAVDDKVQQLIKKKELLEDYKKGVMQQLFSGQLRFKAEDGKDYPDWEEKTLLEVASFRRGSFPQPYGLPEWYDDNGAPFVQVYDVAHNMLLKPKTKQYISEAAQKQSVFVKKGSLILTIQGSIGRLAKTQYDAYVDRTLLIFQSYKVDIDIDYFKYVVYLLFEIEKTKAPGGTIKTITKEQLSAFNVYVPIIEEQQKIATYLSRIDSKIEAVNNQITQTQTFKKGLLQQMFV